MDDHHTKTAKINIYSKTNSGTGVHNTPAGLHNDVKSYWAYGCIIILPSLYAHAANGLIQAYDKF